MITRIRLKYTVGNNMQQKWKSIINLQSKYRNQEYFQIQYIILRPPARIQWDENKAIGHFTRLSQTPTRKPDAD